MWSDKQPQEQAKAILALTASSSSDLLEDGVDRTDEMVVDEGRKEDKEHGHPPSMNEAGGLSSLSNRSANQAEEEGTSATQQEDDAFMRKIPVEREHCGCCCCCCCHSCCCCCCCCC